jgi:toxin ParE1/3/4
MACRVIVSSRAQKEIENAIDFYALYSVNAPSKFIASLNETYNSITENTNIFRVRYKNIRALKLNKFPYALYFNVNQTQNLVRVLSCFHSNRNPEKRPK